MAAIKKGLELDERIKKIADEVFADYERYLPTPQDRKQYQRKRKEYWETITARLKEASEIDGRTAGSIEPAITGAN